MKALRILFLFLLAAFSFAASAQTIEIYKDGRVIDSFTAAQVDSVVYKQVAATPKYYYYYVGTTEPTADNLATIGTETEKTEWTTQKSVACTNNTGVSSYIYYCFATDWNMIYHDSNNFEVQFAKVSTFEVNNIEYTCLRTGRNVPNGGTKDYYATAR